MWRSRYRYCCYRSCFFNNCKSEKNERNCVNPKKILSPKTRVYAKKSDDPKSVKKKEAKPVLGLQKCVNKLSCVYLFSLNVDADKKRALLRDKYRDTETDLDNKIVCKFGRTNDLTRRSSEHEKEYGSLISCRDENSVNLELEVFAHIPQAFLPDTERRLRAYFTENNFDVKHEKYRELICIDKKQMCEMRKLYEEIASIHTLSYQELSYQNKILTLENEILRKDLKISNMESILN